MSGTFTKASFPVAKTDAGEPTLICLNPDGSVPVSSETPGVCFKTPYACITTTETAGTPDAVDIGEVTIALTKVYKCFEWALSSNVDTLFSIIHIDDDGGAPTETTLHEFVLGPANTSDCCKVDCLELDTTGGTGVQKLVVRATALDADCLGPAMGFIAALEQV